MDRAEKAGLGIAVAGHVVLFGLLSASFLTPAMPVKLEPQPIEVSMVDEVGLEATAQQSKVAPDAAEAPDVGKPEEAAPPPPQEAEPAPPAPAPPPPPPKAAPKAKPVEAAKPEPKPVPKPKPAEPPKPEPLPKPAEKPKPKKEAPAKSSPAKASPAKASPVKPSPAPDEPTPSTARHPAKPAPSKAKPTDKTGEGKKPAATAAKPHASKLGDHFLDFIGDKPTNTKSNAPVAAKLDAHAMAGIQEAITRQIQPCADRQVDPGPGANEIVSVLNLKLNADGTLAATPTVVRQTGITDDNSRYARRVVDLGIAAFKGCAPLKLPAEFYQTPSGGWNNINFRWKLQ